MHWKPGAQIAQYEMWGRGIGTARPVTVIEHVSTHLALYSHPGAPIVTRGIENRRSLSLSERTELMMRMLDPDEGEFRRAISPDNHVLTITPRDSWHSVMLFWSSDWQFRTWYVNIQSPLRRVRRGIQLHDYVLDIVVRLDMSWSWKDVEEFEELVARGFFDVDQVSFDTNRGSPNGSNDPENWSAILRRLGGVATRPELACPEASRGLVRFGSDPLSLTKNQDLSS